MKIVNKGVVSTYFDGLYGGYDITLNTVPVGHILINFPDLRNLKLRCDKLIGKKVKLTIEVVE